jgi:biopolymer transport protein ExbD
LNNKNKNKKESINLKVNNQNKIFLSEINKPINKQQLTVIVKEY